MKTYITILKGDVLGEDLYTSTDWTAPYFPRVGDLFSYGFLDANINPDDLYMALPDEKRKKWKDWLDRHGNGMSEEAKKRAVLNLWLNEWQFRISDIYWDQNVDSEYFADVYVRIEDF